MKQKPVQILFFLHTDVQYIGRGMIFVENMGSCWFVQLEKHASIGGTLDCVFRANKLLYIYLWIALNATGPLSLNGKLLVWMGPVQNITLTTGLWPWEAVWEKHVCSHKSMLSLAVALSLSFVDWHVCLLVHHVARGKCLCPGAYSANITIYACVFTYLDIKEKYLNPVRGSCTSCIILI